MPMSDILNQAFGDTSNAGQPLQAGMQLGLQSQQLQQDFAYKQQQLDLEAQKLKDAHMNWGLTAMEKGFALPPSAQGTWFNSIREPMMRLTGVDTSNPAFQSYLKIDPEQNAAVLNQIVGYAKQAQSDPTSTPELKAKSLAIMQQFGKAIGMNNPKDIGDQIQHIYSSIGQGLQGRLSPDQDILKSTITKKFSDAESLIDQFHQQGKALTPEAKALSAETTNFVTNKDHIFSSPIMTQQVLDTSTALTNKVRDQLGLNTDTANQKKEYQSKSDFLRHSLVGAGDVRGQEPVVSGLSNTLDKADAIADSNPSLAKQMLDGVQAQIGKLQGSKESIKYQDTKNTTELSQAKEVQGKILDLQTKRTAVNSALKVVDQVISKYNQTGVLTDYDARLIQKPMAVLQQESGRIADSQQVRSDFRSKFAMKVGELGSLLGDNVNLSGDEVQKLIGARDLFKSAAQDVYTQPLIDLRNNLTAGAASGNPLAKQSMGQNSTAVKMLDNELKQYGAIPQSQAAAKGRQYYMDNYINKKPEFMNMTPKQKNMVLDSLMKKLGTQ